MVISHMEWVGVPLLPILCIDDELIDLCHDIVIMGIIVFGMIECDICMNCDSSHEMMVEYLIEYDI